MAALPVAEPPITLQKTSRWRPRAKQFLLCFFLLAVTGIVYFMTHVLMEGPEVKELSQEQVSDLLKNWLQDHPVRKDPQADSNSPDDWMWDEDEKDNSDESYRSTLQIVTSPKHVMSNRERSRLRDKARVTKLREKYDSEANKMASESTKRPKYISYDMSGSWKDQDDFDCIFLKVRQKVPICLYPDDKDVFVSKQIRSLGVWEGHIMERFQAFLADDKSLGVIDVGANLGQYSLVAAMASHHVLAVEPWESSLRRMRHAAKMAAVQDRIYVLKNVISDSRGERCLLGSVDNQGNVRIQNEATADDIQTGNDDTANTICPNKSFSLFLDDLLPKVTLFKRALLKLDIQGQEHRAFLHAEKLLDAIFVPHIFMEWVIMRSFYRTSSHESLDKALVRRMVALLGTRGYKVFSLVSGKELDTRYWHGWPEDVLWSHSSVIK